MDGDGAGRLLDAIASMAGGSRGRRLPHHEPPPDFGELEARLGRRFEALAGVRYPGGLRLLYRHAFPGLDCGIIRLAPSDPGRPTAALEALATGSWEPDLIGGRGLLAIAEDGNDGGPLCADTTEGDRPDDWPIVLWDHDRRQPAEVVFSSTDRMLAGAAHLLGGGSVAALAAIDPGGAAAGYCPDQKR